jgi:hypothetical protein
MPANATNGPIAIVRNITGQSAFGFSTSDTCAMLAQIPAGGITIHLPSNPSSGDRYEWIDQDGSCSAARPIVVCGFGATVGMAASQAQQMPFSSGAAVYDSEANDWSVVATSAAPALQASVQTYADLTLLEIDSPGAVAFVEAPVSAYFSRAPGSTLAPDGVTVVAAHGDGNWLRFAAGNMPGAAQQALWCVSLLAGRDDADGLTDATPIRTVAEIFRRWGSSTPYLNQPTVVRLLAPNGPGDGWDGVRPVFGPNGSLKITSPLTVLATVTLGAYTPADFAAGTLNLITAQGETGAFWSAYIGKYVLDVTQGAYFFVGQDRGGGQAAISSPRKTPDVFPGQAVTIAAGDVLQICELTTFTFSRAEASGQKGIFNCILLSQLDLAAVNLQAFLGDISVVAESSISSLIGTLTNFNIELYGCFVGAPGAATGPWQGGAQIRGGWFVGRGNDFGPGTVLDDDVVIEQRIHWTGGPIQFGQVYFGQTNTVDSPGECVFSVTSSLSGGPPRVWGPGGFNALNCSLINSSGLAFAAVVLLTGPLTLVGLAAGYYFTGTGFASEPITAAGVDTRGGYSMPTSGVRIANQGAA